MRARAPLPLGVLLYFFVLLPSSFSKSQLSHVRKQRHASMRGQYRAFYIPRRRDYIWAQRIISRCRHVCWFCRRSVFFESHAESASSGNRNPARANISRDTRHSRWRSSKSSFLREERVTVSLVNDDHLIGEYREISADSRGTEISFLSPNRS